MESKQEGQAPQHHWVNSLITAAIPFQQVRLCHATIIIHEERKLFYQPMLCKTIDFCSQKHENRKNIELFKSI